MEKKNGSSIITDSEFIRLLEAARKKQPEAMLEIIELFQPDIEKSSLMVRIPKEDAFSQIITEFLEYIQSNKTISLNDTEKID